MRPELQRVPWWADPTPVGGGIRSLNVTLRQVGDYCVCLRPLRYFTGVLGPVKRPELISSRSAENSRLPRFNWPR